jgi:hypothetical protein
MSRTPTPDVSVPDDEQPAVCPHCGRPFPTARQVDLHVGERHDPSEAERAAYEAAHEDEEDDLFLFHLKVLFALGAVYAAFVVLAVVAFSLAG